MNIAELTIKQAQELAKIEDSSVINSAIGQIITATQTHPFMAWRILHLIHWVESGNYLNIMAGDYGKIA